MREMTKSQKNSIIIVEKLDKFVSVRARQTTLYEIKSYSG